MSGGLGIIITILFYMLTFDNVFTIPMRFISLLFLLLAEIIGIYKSMKFNLSILGIAHLTLSGIHIVFVLLSSIVFVDFLPMYINTYIMINLIGLVILFVFDLCLNSFVQTHKDEPISNGINECLVHAELIYNENKQTKYERKLYELYELIKYSDNSIKIKGEDEILESLKELKDILHEKNETKIMNSITALIQKVEERTIKVKNKQRGRY